MHEEIKPMRNERRDKLLVLMEMHCENKWNAQVAHGIAGCQHVDEERKEAEAIRLLAFNNIVARGKQYLRKYH